MKITSEEIYRQHIDASAAWLMDQYARAVQKALESEPDDEEMPEELDKKCRKLIKKEVRKQRCLRIARKAGRAACAAALTLVMLFGVAGILFTTVEAVRAPIIRFFVEQKEGYLEITDSGEEGDTRTLTNTADFAEMTARLAALLPEGYVQTEGSVSNAETMVTYKNPEGNHILFFASPQAGISHLDAEDATSIERMAIGTHKAILVEKNGYRLAWFDTENNVLYLLVTDSLNREEIISIASRLGTNH